MPFFERRDTVENWFEIDFAVGQERDDLLPNRPVMGEAALKSDGLLDEGIEGKVERLRTPSHFGDLASRADDIKREFERGGDAGGIDDEVEPVAIAEISDPWATSSPCAPSTVSAPICFAVSRRWHRREFR